MATIDREYVMALEARAERYGHEASRLRTELAEVTAERDETRNDLHRWMNAAVDRTRERDQARAIARDLSDHIEGDNYIPPTELRSYAATIASWPESDAEAADPIDPGPEPASPRPWSVAKDGTLVDNGLMEVLTNEPNESVCLRDVAAIVHWENTHNALHAYATEQQQRAERAEAEAARLRCALIPEGNGIACGKVDHHGEMELLLTVGEHAGSVWLSREMWDAFAEAAGWTSGAEARVEELTEALLAARSWFAAEDDCETATRLMNMIDDALAEHVRKVVGDE
jgi:hypothetical protein